MRTPEGVQSQLATAIRRRRHAEEELQLWRGRLQEAEGKLNAATMTSERVRLEVLVGNLRGAVAHATRTLLSAEQDEQLWQREKALLMQKGIWQQVFG